MLVIPAIDLKEGQCVRLRQGDMSDSTVFSDDPVAMAKQWHAQGARRLHLVDLDGAFAGKPVNALLSSVSPRRYLSCRFRSEAVFVTWRRFHSIWRQGFNTPLLAPWPRETLTL